MNFHIFKYYGHFSEHVVFSFLNRHRPAHCTYDDLRSQLRRLFQVWNFLEWRDFKLCYKRYARRGVTESDWSDPGRREAISINFHFFPWLHNCIIYNYIIVTYCNLYCKWNYKEQTNHRQMVDFSRQFPGSSVGMFGQWSPRFTTNPCGYTNQLPSKPA